MSVEPITDTNHGYMSEKGMNPKIQMKKQKSIVSTENDYTRIPKKRQTKFRNIDCIRCGSTKRNEQHD